MQKRLISAKLRTNLILESRNQCAICGSKDFLQLAHIMPIAAGGTNTPENIVVLCPTCHVAADSSRISATLLKEIKVAWIEKGISGKQRIRAIARDPSPNISQKTGVANALADLLGWSEALRLSHGFDASVGLMVNEIRSLNSEDGFIANVLKPLFDALGYEGVCVLHHTGRAEFGKDLVFYERDRLGGFTYYAVVACIGKIHASSSKTRDSGHYAKILDQVEKCFDLPYTDHNLKGEFYIDKVVVACSESISESAFEN